MRSMVEGAGPRTHAEREHGPAPSVGFAATSPVKDGGGSAAVVGLGTRTV